MIDLLPVSLFQGIPGLELDLREEVYERENIVPTFISERTPSKGREDVYALLEEYGMQSLNRLEWLIRTDKQYSGDRLYVGKYEDVCDINRIWDSKMKIFEAHKSAGAAYSSIYIFDICSSNFIKLLNCY